MQGLNADEMLEELKRRGIKQKHIDLIRHSGIDFDNWLKGFDSVEQSVKDTVFALENHPLMPEDIRISGYIMDSVTGKLYEP